VADPVSEDVAVLQKYCSTRYSGTFRLFRFEMLRTDLAKIAEKHDWVARV